MQVVQCAFGIGTCFFDVGYRCVRFFGRSRGDVDGGVVSVEEARELFSYSCRGASYDVDLSAEVGQGGLGEGGSWGEELAELLTHFGRRGGNLGKVKLIIVIL